jgi:hypothetical protein
LLVGNGTNATSETRINPETARIAAASCPFGVALGNGVGLRDQRVISPSQEANPQSLAGSSP